jgi:exodeoxyribonuclease VII large subunit
VDLFEYASQQAIEIKEEKSEVPTVQEQIFTVGQITGEIKSLLTSKFGRDPFWVKGEISNFRGKNHSGHMYFSLKDERAVLNGVFFKNANRNLKVELKDGMEVLAFGRIDLWEPGGKYQLIIEEIRPGGLGELYLRFEQLKKKLESEGLFALERKRKIPECPDRIGVITSPTGAVIRDIITVIHRRCPFSKLVLFPVKVQGDGAAQEIAKAIEVMNRPEMNMDVLIVGRGGGSIEDLWAFNEEIVARAIVGSRVPVISAVGHQTDFTIADFVADVRAATPSQAGEVAVPNLEEMRHRIETMMKNIVRELLRIRELRAEQLAALTRSAPLRDPRVLLRDRAQKLDDLLERIVSNVVMKKDRNRESVDRAHAELLRLPKRLLNQRVLRFQKASSNLNLLSPLGVLSRGYSIARTDGGKVIKEATQVNVGDEIGVRLHQGELKCQVKQTYKTS